MRKRRNDPDGRAADQPKDADLRRLNHASCPERDRLSARDLAIVQMRLSGSSTRAIAQETRLSPGRISAILKLCREWGARCRTAPKPIVPGVEVLIGANSIHPRLAGMTGTVVTITKGDAKFPVAAKQQKGGIRCGGNPIVEIPGKGKFLLRPEHVEVSG